MDRDGYSDILGHLCQTSLLHTRDQIRPDGDLNDRRPQTLFSALIQILRPLITSWDIDIQSMVAGCACEVPFVLHTQSLPGHHQGPPQQILTPFAPATHASRIFLTESYAPDSIIRRGFDELSSPRTQQESSQFLVLTKLCQARRRHY